MNYVTMFLFSIENSSNVVIKRTCIFRLYSKIRDIPKLYFFNVKGKKKILQLHTRTKHKKACQCIENITVSI